MRTGLKPDITPTDIPRSTPLPERMVAELGEAISAAAAGPARNNPIAAKISKLRMCETLTGPAHINALYIYEWELKGYIDVNDGQ